MFLIDCLKDLLNRLFGRKEGEIDWSKVEVKTPTLYTIDELNKMTKVQIDEYGEKFGLKLDRRWAKKRMITDLLANGLVKE